MTFSSPVLRVDVDGAVATLWLARPDQRNAMGSAVWRDLPLAAEAVAESGARVLVLAAEGRAFTVGLDLKEFGPGFAGGRSATSPAASNAAAYAAVRSMQASVNAIADLTIPTIAAVHGYCLGAGIDLTSATDIRLGARDAIFSIRETKVAIVADLGTLQRFPRIVGPGHANELAFTGRDFDAAHAERIGFLNRVVEGSGPEVYAAALELAREIAANSPLVVQGTKAVLAANDGRTVDEGLDFVARWNTMYLRSDDLTEAMTAFLERRPPNFTGQ